MNRLSQTIPYQKDARLTPFTAAEFDDALISLQENGFHGIELMIGQPRIVDVDGLLKKLEKHELKCTTISTGGGYGSKGYHLCAENEEQRLGAIDYIKDQVDLSVRIGHPFITIGIIRGKGNFEHPEISRAKLAESMKPCLEYAAKKGAVLQIEAINHTEVACIHSTDDALSLCHELGDPAELGLLFDVYHSDIEDGDICAAVRRAAGRITNVHLADTDRALPGDGKIDFVSAIREILSTGYDGAFALENANMPSAAYTKAMYGPRLCAIAREAGMVF